MQSPPSTPPRSDSLPMRHLSPRTTSLHSSTTPEATPSRLPHPSPRLLFADQPTRRRSRSPEAIPLSNQHSRYPGVGSSALDSSSYIAEADNDDDFEFEDLEKGDVVQVAQRLSFRPPALDLTQVDALPNVRLSTGSESIKSAESSDSSTPPSAQKRVMIQPTVALLFSLQPVRTQLPILVPALLATVIAGLIPPYMTELLGQSFGAFTTYTVAVSGDVTGDAISAAKAQLLKSAQLYSIQFAGLAVLTILSSCASFTLWILHGERVARDLRLEVFCGVGRRDMEWFDLGMGANEVTEEDCEDGEAAGEGAGGLMGRFSKETDEVRIACSSSMGLVVQYSISFIACLCLSFYRDWRLTFVILASVPALILTVAFTERSTSALLPVDKTMSAKSSARVDRVLGAMPTVKAFNAEDKELSGFKALTMKASQVYVRLHLIYGIRLGITQFIVLSMFVQGFWFGAFLVRTGRSSAAAVNTCFWASVLASSFLQMIVPLLVVLEKGKMSMANLLDLSRAPVPTTPAPVLAVPTPASPTVTTPRGGKFAFRVQGRRRGELAGAMISRPLTKEHEAFGGPLSSRAVPLSPTAPQTPTFVPIAVSLGKRGKPRRALRKLRPAKFTGELSLKAVTFHYPTRPSPAPAALNDVSLYLAACETTYIVGGSGSGKSTVASLLLGLYRPEVGRVEVEEQGLEWIDEDWLRGHVACVSQGASVLFDGSVHDNVAIGVVGQIRDDGTTRDVQDVTRDEVIAACRGALIHEFVRDLPEGYDTFLSGEKGASLSGGQRQRLALARAWIRNPTVLILDEATSALDATSRLLVSEAVKHWRKNQTTIVITHDLTPISEQDYVYVMADGRVVEEGYRKDLEANFGGPFHLMAHSHGAVQDENEILETLGYDSDADDHARHLSHTPSLPSVLVTPQTSPHGSPRPASPATTPRQPPTSQFLSPGGTSWSTPDDDLRNRPGRASLQSTRERLSRASRGSLQSLATLQTAREGHRPVSRASALPSARPSPYLSPHPSPGSTAPDARTGSFLSLASYSVFGNPNDLATAGRELKEARRASSRFEPRLERQKSNVSLAYPPELARRAKSYVEEPPMYDYTQFNVPGQRDSSMSFAALDFTARQAALRRPGGERIKHATMVSGDGLANEWRQRASDGADDVAIDIDAPTAPRQMTLTAIAKRYYPTIPNKSLFWLGIFFSVGVGAMTPVFSSLLAKLMTNIGSPGGNPIVVRTALLILLIAFLDGMGTFLKFYLFERCAMEWACALRVRAFALVTKQDKAWLDAPENSTGKLANMLIKDTEDARTLVGSVAGYLVVVVSMMVIGLVWAFAVGWELTLVGLGLGPVFVFATRFSSQIQTKFEGQNKALRESVSTKFHQNVSNIRAIRSMSIERVFESKFETVVQQTYVGGAKAAPLAGFGYALGGSLTYFAEALMFYVGAILITHGRYTFGKMVEVFTLIIFSITFSSQIMANLPALTKSVRAAIDIARLLDLSLETRESEGRETFPIIGRIEFDHVGFAYPQRPEVQVLQSMSFEVRPGECVGIVGASGSGKSTVTALLQRLYEPSSGTVLLDGRPLDTIATHYLRDHIAVVSQHPALFDMTIHDNIAYGNDVVSEDAVIHAARAAHVHDFIMTLPKGYQTMLGENASLISGGQAQRLQIARALVRPREILILDECTSALDAVNQAAVMQTILAVKEGKTTLIVTHKLDVMKECDRLLVLDSGGIVAESGTFAELRAKQGGLFAMLASSGEWEHQ